MTIDQEDKNRINELINSYRNLHDEIHSIENEIKDLEVKMKQLFKDKDRVISSISENRDTESLIMKDLSEKLGDGKLDIPSMEWIKTN